MFNFSILFKFMLSDTLIAMNIRPTNFPFCIEIHEEDSIKCIKFFIVLKYILVKWYAIFLLTLIKSTCAIF
jgi:hypothetical protein